MASLTLGTSRPYAEAVVVDLGAQFANTIPCFPGSEVLNVAKNGRKTHTKPWKWSAKYPLDLILLIFDISLVICSLVLYFYHVCNDIKSYLGLFFILGPITLFFQLRIVLTIWRNLQNGIEPWNNSDHMGNLQIFWCLLCLVGIIGGSFMYSTPLRVRWYSPIAANFVVAHLSRMVLGILAPLLYSVDRFNVARQNKLK